MNTIRPSLGGRLAPYGAALIGVVLGYGGARLVSNQQMLAVGVATVSALGCYLVARVIQMRGKLTLGLTAFGFPLLVAIACILFMRLTPFLDRQRSINQLRESGIAYSARAPDQSGEWLRDRSGNMLPTWLASWLGPECMAEVRTINADVAALQQADFSKLQTSKLRKVTLRREAKLPPLSSELVSWLNGCPELDTIWLQLAHYTKADSEALALLDKSSKIQFDTEIDNATGQLHLLPKECLVRLTGRRLTIEHAKHIAELKSPRLLTLEFPTVMPGALRALAPMNRDAAVYIVGAALAYDDVVDLAMLGQRSVTLTAVLLPKELNSELAQSSGIETRWLTFRQTQVSLPQLQHLSRLFNCEWVSLMQPISDTELSAIWSTTGIQQLHCNDGTGWQRFTRPETLGDTE